MTCHDMAELFQIHPTSSQSWRSGGGCGVIRGVGGIFHSARFPTSDSMGIASGPAEPCWCQWQSTGVCRRHIQYLQGLSFCYLKAARDVGWVKLKTKAFPGRWDIHLLHLLRCAMCICSAVCSDTHLTCVHIRIQSAGMTRDPTFYGCRDARGAGISEDKACSCGALGLGLMPLEASPVRAEHTEGRMVA